jgi:hypothetical protein
MKLLHTRKYAVSFLVCLVTETIGVLHRRKLPTRLDNACEDLEKLPHIRARSLLVQNQTVLQTSHDVSLSCQIANSTNASSILKKDDSEATCSPVCTEALDIVVVLGTSEWSLEESDASYLRQSSISLLKHFDLSHGRGSLFGFLDVSRGVEQTRVLTPLNDKRNDLVEQITSWRPKLGGKAVTALDLQGFEQRPEVLAMLNISRSNVRRTLLYMQLPQRSPTSAKSSNQEFLQAFHDKADPFARDHEIMEMLVSACPAIRIDPSMPCGRMRWGSTDTDDSKKIKPWGSQA